VKEREYVDVFVYVYENITIKPVETVVRRGKGG
jgi:hypothetical protein